MLILLLFIDDASKKVLDFRIKREDKNSSEISYGC